MNNSMPPVRVTPEFLRTLNELLPKAPAAVAYFLGIATTLAWSWGLAPDAKLLESVARAKDIREIGEIFTKWKGSRCRPAGTKRATKKRG